MRIRRLRWTSSSWVVMQLCSLSCAVALHLLTSTSLPAVPMHAQDRSIEIPRNERADITIDGFLSEPVWGQAAVLTGFFQYLPADDKIADDSTEILVWYSQEYSLVIFLTKKCRFHSVSVPEPLWSRVLRSEETSLSPISASSDRMLRLVTEQYCIRE